MIKYIKRKDIEVEKYDKCITESLGSIVYGYSWYLDIVADNWDVMVLDDYRAVMPIPWKKKYGIKYITQPFHCQQLGVFSSNDLSREIQEIFIKDIPRKFFKVSLNYHSKHLFLSEKFIKKKNYVLILNETYTHLFKSFSKGRKHAVKVGEKKGLTLGETSISSLITIQNNFYNYTGFSKDKLEELSEYTIQKNKGVILGVFKDDLLIGGAFFLKTKTRIVYLFSSFTNEGRKLQASSFLISSIIKKYESSNLILDFEGGNMPNIGSFYKSFGAEIELYYFFKRNFL